MTIGRKRLLVAAGAGLGVLLAALIPALVWLRGTSGGDPVAKLPADVEAYVRVASLPDVAGDLARVTGLRVDALRQTGWKGRFGGAAVGLRGGDAVAAIECPRAGRFVSLEAAVVEALHLDKRPGGAFALAGHDVWLGSRGNWLWIATSQALLKDALACADREAPLGPSPAFEIVDLGLVARLDGDAAAGRLDDISSKLYRKARGAVTPGARVRGAFTADGVLLQGETQWKLSTKPMSYAKHAAASRPPATAKLSAVSIPGLACRHDELFSAPYVWQDIVADPENGHVVDMFQHEIADYEKFLGGKKFERDLLPKIGPEFQWAVARVDWASFGVRPKSPVPAILLACPVRGIEADALKSIDRFLTKAEVEGHGYDLPAPRGKLESVRDPFRHEKVTFHGVEIIRIDFREGVSQFGQEFWPGYAVLDGTLWFSTYWPLLSKIAPAAPDPRDGHAWGEIDGPSARGIARDMAGEFAEMGATRVILDRVAPQAEADFAAFYGPPDKPTDAFFRQFTRLENELKQERPNLNGSAFDVELEDRLRAWEGGERRAYAATRAEPLKKTPDFRADVARRRDEFLLRVDLFEHVQQVDWILHRETPAADVEADRWELRITLSR